jgi:hypothetical protein
MNNLVYGGTPDKDSNRMIENTMFTVMDFVPEDEEDLFHEEIMNARSLDELTNVLLNINYHDINIVGTRGYIYQSIAMANVIEGLRHLAVDGQWKERVTLLTRTLGIRSRFIELMLQDSMSKRID